MEYSHKSMTGSLVHDTSNTVRDSDYTVPKYLFVYTHNLTFFVKKEKA